MAEEVAAEAFERGLLMETSGAYSEVVKFLPPLTIPDEALEEGLGIMVDSLRTVADRNAAPVLAG
jgi:diaminobutyrate-2-oxoglutarate transaminase